MLSILVINFKNPALLRLCLKSITTVVAPDFKHEIIVVDVASSIETSNIVREEFKGVKLLSFKENIGFTRGVNEGIKNSQGDAYLILNPDIVPLRGSIEGLYNYLKNNSDAGMVGPRLLNFDGTPQNSCFKFPTLLTLLFRRTFLGRLPFARKGLEHFLMKNSDLSKDHPVDWLMGSALLVSRKAVSKVGLMDERLFLYMNDVDWPRQFWENGYKVVYYPESVMYHYHKRESKGYFLLLDIFYKKETRWHLKDAITYFKKHGLKIPRYS